MDAENDSLEDAALARRIARGHDPEAELMLCRRLFPRIRAYALRRLRDDAGASDLAQHVLLVVLESLRAGRVADENRLAAFVMGTCRNTLIEWKKVDRRRHALLDKYGPTFAQAVESEPAAADSERLAHCLEALAPREQTIVVLTYFAEKEAVEIARELAMSAGSVRVARHRALVRLHECMTRGEAP